MIVLFQHIHAAQARLIHTLLMLEQDCLLCAARMEFQGDMNAFHDAMDRADGYRLQVDTLEQPASVWN